MTTTTTGTTTKKAPAKKAAAKTVSGKTLKVTLIASRNGRKPGMLETVTGLGLKKIGQTRELVDTPAVRGMIERVKHLVRVDAA